MEENQQHPEAGEEKKAMTPQEIQEMRKKIVTDYREEIKFLKVQSEYEELLAKIEESKLRKYSAIAKLAQLFDHMESQEEAMKEYMEAQKAAEEQATKEQSKNTASEENADSAEKSPRKPRKLATS